MKMKKDSIGRSRIMLVWAALLLTSRLGIAQEREKGWDQSRPLARVHFSTGKLNWAEAVAQAIARETADAIAGKIEQPSMAPTRSTFLAKWQTAPGATGYRLDVSTSPSFETYVSRYRDLDLGNVTSQIVSGLKPRTQYYYRVRPYNSAGTGSDSETMPATTASTNTGLVIVPSFDPTITSDPRSGAIQAMIVSAIQGYQALFSDPVTVTIYFRLSTVDASGDPMGTKVGGSNSTCYIRDWNLFLNALRADAKSPDDASANATLPTTALSTNIVARSANGRAIGLITPPAMFADGHLDVGGPYDGVVTLNPDWPLQFTRPVSPGNFDAQMFTEHEIDEVLGFGSHLDSSAPEFLEPEDLFTWASLNARNTTPTGQRHFSVDRGLHYIVTLNQEPGGDFGDFESESPCPQNHPRVQNAFNCPGQTAVISATSPEGIILDVMGWDLITDNGNPGAGALGNISTGLSVGTGNNILIAGFQITGNGNKQVVLRAIGPSLTQFGLSNVLPDPTLELHDSTGAIVATNDDWPDGSNAQSIPTVLRPTHGLESVILTTLNRGAYTAVVRGYNDGTGTALAEVYDVSGGTATQLANISTRGVVQTGNNVMIAGVVVQNHDKGVVVRALGPSLAGFGVPNALSDPTLDLYNSSGSLLLSNDDWQDTQQSILTGTGLAPTNELESAITGTLAPGSYTAVVRGYENATGNALVEVYGLN
jgi:hypothetical protein